MELDAHRELLVACIIDSEGQCLERHGTELSRSNLERFAKDRLREGDGVGLGSNHEHMGHSGSYRALRRAGSGRQPAAHSCYC